MKTKTIFTLQDVLTLIKHSDKFDNNDKISICFDGDETRTFLLPLIMLKETDDLTQIIMGSRIHRLNTIMLSAKVSCIKFDFVQKVKDGFTSEYYTKILISI